MNPPNQPTPRTNAAWAKTFEFGVNQFWSGNAANQMRDECEKLERELTETERLRFGADADRRRLRAELSAVQAQHLHEIDELAAQAKIMQSLRAEVERLKFYIATTIQPEEHAKVIKDLRALSDQLSDNLSAVGAAYNTEKARAEKAEAAFADPHTLHAHCLRTLTEGQIAHLFGERMTEIVNRAEKAEAELITEQTRLDYLGLHMGTALVAHALDCDYSRCFPIRDAIDLAMKNESNP
jgi:hypothetical protein